MKTIRYSLLLLLFLSVLGGESFAQQLIISGQVRPRAEYRHGFKTLFSENTDAAFFIDQRTRLNLDFSNEKVRLYLSVQDIRVWGNTNQLVTADGLTSLHQGWAQVFLSPKFSVKAGRQEIIYDDHRIFGNVDWAQQARSHDAFLLKYQDSTWKADAGFAFNQSSAGISSTYYSLTNNYKAFQYGWFHKDFSKKTGLSVLVLNNGLQAERTDTAGNLEYKINYSQTAGFRLTHKGDKLSANLAAYYQGGKMNDWDGMEISAYFVNPEVGYKVTDKFSTTLGMEYLSGNSQTDTAGTQNHAFNPFYGTNHKFNGLMDYFYVGNHIGSVGLIDPYLKLNYKAGKVAVGMDVHYFMSAGNVLDLEALMNTGEIKAMESGLGTEIDLYATYKIAPDVKIQGGYSHLFATETMEALKGGDSDVMQNWAWLMLDVNPVLLKETFKKKD